MVKRIVTFFDKLEDKVRIRLSHRPIIYALVGAVGIILMWKGIWEVAEHYSILDGWGSIIIGTIILLMSGLLVSFFIGDSIIMSGFKRDKKLTDKTEKEILAAEKSSTAEILEKIEHLEADVHELVQKHEQESSPALFK